MSPMSPRVAVSSLAEGDEIAALLVRIARRDRAALRDLYERLGGQALAVAVSVLRSRPEAEEATQEAFVDVWQRAESYDRQRGSGRAWVYSLVRNRAIDRLRRHQLALRTVERARTEVHVRPARPPTPGEEADRQEERDQIQRALADLPEPQRLALQMAYFEGLSQSEIAARIDEPLGTVKNRMRAALDKLSRLLGAEGSLS